jgi:hypothetical protein
MRRKRRRRKLSACSAREFASGRGGRREASSGYDPSRLFRAVPPMTLRESFRPLRPDLDNFLFAAVGAENNGVPLSMISALAQLGLDPWEEAGRLSSLGRREAVEQLARLIVGVPGASRALAEARELAGGLVERLPGYDGSSGSSPPPKRGRQRLRWPSLPRQSQFLVFCIVVALAALVSIGLHGGFSLGMG